MVTLTLADRFAFTFILVSTCIRDGLRGTNDTVDRKARALLLAGASAQQA